MPTPDHPDILRLIERLSEVHPSSESTRRAIERAHVALLIRPVQKPSYNRRRNMLLRIAAGVIVVAGITGLITWLVPTGNGQSIAFADVQQKMKGTRTVTYQITNRTTWQPDRTTRVMVLGSDLTRVELPDGSVTIVDLKKHQFIQIMPKEKKVVIRQGFELKEPMNLYDHLRNWQKAASRRLPEREIDGKKTIGFQVNDNGLELKVWVDPVTKLPIRAESSAKIGDGQEVHEVYSEFVFDSQLDEALFRLKPPADYIVEKQETVKPAPNQNDKDDLPLIVTPRVGIGPARFGMSQEEVIQALGQPDKIENKKIKLPEVAKKTYRGPTEYQSLKYNLRGFKLTIWPKRGLTNIACESQKSQFFFVRDFKGKTKEGIAIGASVKDIKKAYGKPDQERSSQNTTYLRYDQLGLRFFLRDDQLINFSARKVGR